ncbi:hypothetical protein CTheo_1926 [Ceratobasidium theobromae]|uniref:Cytochrome oxidase complex assembly protein n=1 Tax=Ceratobasidium theobromae TaxID=1582974 RepID=A0A5N5QSB9_9AGAM|nr:hypothetical protein CTheo_1926 [Ceratobasidium theobromae]
MIHRLSRGCAPVNRILYLRSISSSRGVYAKLNLTPPPPGPPPPPPMTFDAPSKPRMVHERPQPRDLPVIRSRVPALITLGVLGLSAWAGFIVYATNQERLASSVTKQVLTQLRASPEVVAQLGPGVVAEPTWWMIGQPYVDGAVGSAYARIIPKEDINESRAGAGRVYFTSIRKEKGQPFTILRFKLICDNGVILENLHREGNILIS